VARDRAREKLYDSLTALLQTRFNDGEQYLAEYEKLCHVDVPADASPEQKKRLQEEELSRQSNRLYLIGKGREDQGRLVDAFQAYEDFGLLTGNRELVRVLDEPSTSSRPDVWARGRIAALVNKADPEKRKPLEDLIRQKFERLRAGNDLDTLRGFVSVFGETASVGRQARLELAARLLAVGGEDELRDAELHLLQLQRGAGEDRAAAARSVELLARLLIRKGLLEDAVGCYRQLGELFGDVVLPDGRSGADHFNEVFSDKRFVPYLEQPRPPWSSRYRGQDVSGQQTALASAFTFEPQGDLLPFFNRYRLVLDANGSGGWHFKVLDRAAPAGKPRMDVTVQVNPYAYSNVYGNAANPRVAFARGHLLVICLNHTVYAFDLADGRKLWERDLLGKSAANGQPQQVMSDNDGGLWMVSQDGTRKRLGQVGVVEASYVCLQTRDGLEALDPVRGTVLWKKTDVPSQCHIFGDDRFVYLVEVGADGNSYGKTHAVRASDGVSVPVPDFSALFTPAKRVRVLGGRLLLYEDGPEGKVLRLYDVQAGKDDWRQQLPGGSALIRSEDPGLIGALEPTGRFRVYDLATRKVRFEGELAEEDLTRPGVYRPVSKHIELIPKLQDAHLFLDHERYYLGLNPAPDPKFHTSPNVSGLRAERVGGPLYAFDRQTNKPLWFADDIGGQHLVLERFDELPLLLFASQFNRFNPQNNTLEESGAWVTAIDRRTGRMAYNNRKLPANNGPFISVSADPQSGVIELARFDLRVKLLPEGAPAQGRTDARIGAAGGAPAVPLPLGAAK
jgi:hypothetical protein